MKEMKDIGERKAVLLAERNVQAVVSRRGLQLEVERTAKALAQRQAPGLVNARSKRRVDNELHAAAFVEEALGDYRGLRGNRPKQCAARYNIFDSLLRARIVEAAFGFEPIHRSGDASGISISIWRLARNKRADFLA